MIRSRPPDCHGWRWWHLFSLYSLYTTLKANLAPSPDWSKEDKWCTFTSVAQSCNRLNCCSKTWSRSLRRRGRNLDIIVAHADGLREVEFFNTADDDRWTKLAFMPEDCGIDGVALAGHRSKVKAHSFYCIKKVAWFPNLLSSESAFLPWEWRNICFDHGAIFKQAAIFVLWIAQSLPEARWTLCF